MKEWKSEVVEKAGIDAEVTKEIIEGEPTQSKGPPAVMIKPKIDISVFQTAKK